MHLKNSNIKILGKVDIRLVKGAGTSPLVFSRTKNLLFVTEKDLTGTHKYCRAMNWQNIIGALTFFTINYLGPWNYPCYMVESYSGSEPKNVAYRENAIKEKMKLAAKKIGGNAVVGVEFAGEALVNTNNGQVLSSSEAWSGVGFIIKM